jgi:hypothetical protein
MPGQRRCCTRQVRCGEAILISRALAGRRYKPRIRPCALRRLRPHGEEPAVRLAEPIAALSLATDLGTGPPIEHALPRHQASRSGAPLRVRFDQEAVPVASGQEDEIPGPQRESCRLRLHSTSSTSPNTAACRTIAQANAQGGLKSARAWRTRTGYWQQVPGEPRPVPRFG